MANLPAAAVWSDVYQLETTDPILGGSPNPSTGDGMDNIPHLQLANRTEYLLAQIAAMQTLIVPTGAVQLFLRTTPPSGWLELNGQTVSRSTYAGLFTVLGALAGPGDGVTTFSVPDYRAEFFRAWDHGRGVDADRALGTFQSDLFAAHSHTIGVANFGNAGGSSDDQGPSEGTSINTSTVGGTETRPRNVALLACIKT